VGVQFFLIVLAGRRFHGRYHGDYHGQCVPYPLVKIWPRCPKLPKMEGSWTDT